MLILRKPARLLRGRVHFKTSTRLPILNLDLRGNAMAIYMQYIKLGELRGIIDGLKSIPCSFRISVSIDEGNYKLEGFIEPSSIIAMQIAQQCTRDLEAAIQDFTIQYLRSKYRIIIVQEITELRTM